MVKLTCAGSLYTPCAVSFNGLSAFYGCIVCNNPMKEQLNNLLLNHNTTMCLKCHCAAYSKSSSEMIDLYFKEI